MSHGRGAVERDPQSSSMDGNRSGVEPLSATASPTQNHPSRNGSHTEDRLPSIHRQRPASSAGANDTSGSLLSTSDLGAAARRLSDGHLPSIFALASNAGGESPRRGAVAFDEFDLGGTNPAQRSYSVMSAVSPNCESLPASNSTTMNRADAGLLRFRPAQHATFGTPADLLDRTASPVPFPPRRDLPHWRDEDFLPPAAAESAVTPRNGSRPRVGFSDRRGS